MHAGRTVRVTFQSRAAARRGPTAPDGKPMPTTASSGSRSSERARVDAVTLEPPLLTALITANREKRRRVSLTLIPKHMVQAVLAIEDRRFYEHPGIDPIRMVGAHHHQPARRQAVPGRRQHASRSSWSRTSS